MKKILALVLAFCMMMAVLPVFAETAEAETGSALENLFAGILGGDGTLAEKASSLLEKISSLKDEFTGSDNQFSAFISSLSEKLQGLIQPGEEGLSSLLSGLKDLVSGNGDVDLNSLLGGILGGDGEGEGFDLNSLLGSSGEEGEGEGFDLNSLLDSSGEEGEEGTEGIDLNNLLGGLLDSSGEEVADEDDESLAETIERLNREAEAATGDDVPGKKAAESVEEFYGLWTESKFVFGGEAYDMSEYNEGVFIAENTYYVTLEGAKCEDFLYPETAELSIRDGALKVNSDGHWSTFVLTEDGELVMVGGSLLTYYVRAGE